MEIDISHQYMRVSFKTFIFAWGSETENQRTVSGAVNEENCRIHSSFLFGCFRSLSLTDGVLAELSSSNERSQVALSNSHLVSSVFHAASLTGLVD